MNHKTNRDQTAYLYNVLCIVITIVSLMPVTCNYIMQGGVIEEWINAVEAIAIGVPQPSIKSNLWYFIPGLLKRLSGDIVLTYRIWMLFVQVATAIFAKRLFTPLFEDRMQALFGFLLYMTSPYRIYISYDLADISQTIVYMLLPLYGLGLLGLLKDRKTIVVFFLGALALAGIGYAEPVFFVIVLGISLMVAVVSRRLYIFVIMGGGTVLFLPGMYRLIKYLFLNGYPELNIQPEMIMERGYRFGELFTVYTWKEGHPGMGMGLLVCLLAGLWIRFVVGNKEKSFEGRWLLIIGIGLGALSLRCFPWNIVQRLGIWALKFVSLLETPAIFWGLACAVFSIAGADYISRIRKYLKEPVASALPIIVLLFCMGCCIYQCNTLTYERLPILFP